MVTMVSSFVGIAIVALPSGIITAGYMNELKKLRSEDENAPELTALSGRPTNMPRDL